MPNVSVSALFIIGWHDRRPLRFCKQQLVATDPGFSSDSTQTSLLAVVFAPGQH